MFHRQTLQATAIMKAGPNPLMLIVMLTLLAATASGYYSDEGIPVLEVGPGLSIRTLKVENGSVRLTWINRPNYTEPNWE